MVNSNLFLDPICLGKNLILVDVIPDYFGSDKERHSEAVGFKYELMLPEHKFDKLLVKISGKQLLEKPISGAEPVVELKDLKVRPYVSNGRLAFSASASGISLAAKAAKA